MLCGPASPPLQAPQQQQQRLRITILTPTYMSPLTQSYSVLFKRWVNYMLKIKFQR